MAKSQPVMVRYLFIDAFLCETTRRRPHAEPNHTWYGSSSLSGGCPLKELEESRLSIPIGQPLYSKRHAI